MGPKDKLVCDVHCDVRTDLQNLQRTQTLRSCGDHEARIKVLELSDSKQWDAINDLQRTVWRGVGILTAAGFLGSLIGGAIFEFLRWKL